MEKLKQYNDTGSVKYLIASVSRTVVSILAMAIKNTQ